MDYSKVIQEVMQYSAYLPDIKNALFIDKQTYKDTEFIRNKLIDSKTSLTYVNYGKQLSRTWYSKCKLKIEYEFYILRNCYSTNNWDDTDIEIKTHYPSVFTGQTGYVTTETIIPHGVYRRWYENGNLQFETTMNNGQFHGYSYEYHPNGNLSKNYYIKKNDRYKGLYQEFYEDGQIKIEKSYKNGELHGWYTTWFPDGEIDTSKKYDRGIVTK